MVSRDELLPCQQVDPQRGSFEPHDRGRARTRMGKTRQDQMPVDKRPRVLAWKRRGLAMRGIKQTPDPEETT